MWISIETDIVIPRTINGNTVTTIGEFSLQDKN